jgi:hypothetical protein
MGTSDALDRVKQLVGVYTSLAHSMPAQKLEACTFQDFRAAIRAVGVEVLSQEALQARVGGLDSDNLPAHIMAQWQQTVAEQFLDGGTVLVAPFPCNLNGKVYTAEEVRQGTHIHIVPVNVSTRRGVHGDGMFAVLPLQIWNAGTFKVHFERDSANPSIATIEHTRYFLREVLDHFNNVADLLQ